MMTKGHVETKLDANVPKTLMSEIHAHATQAMYMRKDDPFRDPNENQSEYDHDTESDGAHDQDQAASDDGNDNAASRDDDIADSKR